MIRQLVLFGVLFAAGISFGAWFTPVGMDMAERYIQPTDQEPVQTSPRNTSKDRLAS